MEIVWTFPLWKMSMEFMDSNNIYTIEFGRPKIYDGRHFYIMDFPIFSQRSVQKNCTLCLNAITVLHASDFPVKPNGLNIPASN